MIPCESAMIAVPKMTGQRSLWVGRSLGVVLVSHFTFVLIRSLYLGVPEETLWICHVGTLLGGVGALLQDRRLISMALVICFGHHLFWVCDTLSWLITGSFAVGATAYLQDSGLGGWIQSANHFFAVPALLALVWIQGSVDKRAWLWASVLLVFLVAISLLVLPPVSNVNCAHRPWPGFESFISRFIALRPFSPVRYVLFIVGATVLGNYLPVNFMIAYIIPRRTSAAVRR
jgi:hypothetical protein